MYSFVTFIQIGPYFLGGAFLFIVLGMAIGIDGGWR